MLEWIQAADVTALLWIQENLRNALLTPLMTVYTQLGNAGILWIVLSVLLLCHKKTRKAGLFALLAMLLGLLCTNVILKNLVGRARPWTVLAELIPLVAENDPNSFPSGHTCAAFAAAGVWYRGLPRRWMKVLGVVLAAVMGFSRLYVGVHYPSDVVAGCLVGLACSQVMWLVCTRLTARWQRGGAA